jgi:hypothetical protein
MQRIYMIRYARTPLLVLIIAAVAARSHLAF